MAKMAKNDIFANKVIAAKPIFNENVKNGLFRTFAFFVIFASTVYKTASTFWTCFFQKCQKNVAKFGTQLDQKIHLS